MLKGVSIGLGMLVLAVFAYVGYSTNAMGRSSAGASSDAGMAAARSRTDVRAEPSGGSSASTLPVMPTTTEVEGGPNSSAADGGAGAAATGMTTPTTDSVAANPPNGMRFGGSGHYQLYRQGDLTWRLNTDTGETCVIFATDEEWRKPKVFRSGCRGRQ